MPNNPTLTIDGKEYELVKANDVWNPKNQLYALSPIQVKEQKQNYIVELREQFVASPLSYEKIENSTPTQAQAISEAIKQMLEYITDEKLGGSFFSEVPIVVEARSLYHAE